MPKTTTIQQDPSHQTRMDKSGQKKVIHPLDKMSKNLSPQRPK